MSEINNTVEGIDSRFDEAEKRISDLKEKVGKKNPTKAEQNSKKKTEFFKNE